MGPRRGNNKITLRTLRLCGSKKWGEAGKGNGEKVMTDEKERFEILQEHMDRKFDVISEGYQALDEKLDRKFDFLNSKIDANHNEIKNQLSLAATNLRGKIEVVDRKVDRNREEIVINRESIEGNREAIEGNRNSIEAHDQKLDRVIGKIEDHDQRIRRLEPV